MRVQRQAGLAEALLIHKREGGLIESYPRKPVGGTCPSALLRPAAGVW